MKISIIASLFIAAIATPLATNAEPYPSQPIQIVVPVASGGNTDIATRLLASTMKDSLGQPLIVENRTGAGGAIGAAYVAHAKPNGYTLLAASNGQLAVGPVVNPNSGYDPIKDLAPIGLVFRVPLALTVPANSEIKTADDFIKASRGTHGVTVGTSGAGGAQDIMVARLAAMAKANIVRIAYRGGSAIMPDLIAGNIDATLNELPNVLEFHKQGRVRIIAIASDAPVDALHGVPTLSATVPEFVAYSTSGWLAPAGTDKDIIEKLRSSLAKALSQQAVKEKFLQMGMVAASENDVSPKTYGALIAKDYRDTQEIVKKYGITAQ